MLDQAITHRVHGVRDENSIDRTGLAGGESSEKAQPSHPLWRIHQLIPFHRPYTPSKLSRYSLFTLALFYQADLI
jgi:hypothetical protein